jgi:hypothetical protein
VTARARTDAVRSLHHQRRDLHQLTYLIPLRRLGLNLLSSGIRTPSSSSNAIKLESRAMLATKSDLVVSINIDVSFHALVCRQVLFSPEDITTLLPRAITNLLQEFKDVFPTEITLRLPPLRGIEHQIDLIPGTSLPNRAV